MIFLSTTILLTVEKNTVVKGAISVKKDYMTLLERAARWRLPPQEAEDVIADYRDIVADPPRSEDQLRREVGDPVEVIKLLVAPPKVYRTWLAVFAVAAACILAVGFSGTFIGYPFWMLLFDGGRGGPCYAPQVAALGAITALVWFRLCGRKEGRLSRAVPVLLGVCLLCIAGVLLFCLACSRDFEAFTNAWGTMTTWLGPNRDLLISRSFYLSRMAMCYGSAVLAPIGAYSLVKARMGDRRWAAVYVLALTAITISLLVVYWTGSIDVGATEPTVEEWFRQMLLRCSAAAAVGIVGTGVALC